MTNSDFPSKVLAQLQAGQLDPKCNLSAAGYLLESLGCLQWHGCNALYILVTRIC
jgi:hypothetical protein